MGEDKGTMGSTFAAGVVGLVILVGGAIGLYALREQGGKPENIRRRALEVVDHVVYVRDARAEVCFAVSWVVDGQSRTYLMSWVPCVDRLPVANQPATVAPVHGGWTL